MKSILSMNSIQARDFLLKPESYSNIELPIYFDFGGVIKKIINGTDGKLMSDFYNDKLKPQDFDNVNYKIVKNKNGRYDWRPIELIHPFLYVELVKVITNDENWQFINKKFSEFQNNKNIECCSMPGESKTKKHDKIATIYNWINRVEQDTIKLSLKYKCMAITDITNCYSSIYTHTISWALHTEKEAKKRDNRHDNKLLGNVIDKLLRKMNYDQTNGIPQGSVLTDFIAEIVLGYADQLLSEELKKMNASDYKILRYRDDYRIFANSEKDINIILKKLTEILLHLNLKVNSNKTLVTDKIIINAMKKDKYELLSLNISPDLDIERHLLIIKQISDNYIADSQLKVLLTDLYNSKIKNLKLKPLNYEQIISIIVDIMIRKPGLYNISTAILSEILKFLSINQRIHFINMILDKFEDIPNTEYLSLWLQRLTISSRKTKNYDCDICNKLIDNSITLWNSDWLDFDICEETIINTQKLSEVTEVVSSEEVDRFNIADYREMY